MTWPGKSSVRLPLWLKKVIWGLEETLGNWCVQPLPSGRTTASTISK